MLKKPIFNSVGSNYTYLFGINAIFSNLFGFGGENARQDLREVISKHYDGVTALFYKGREAIEYALLLSGIPKGSHIIISGYTCAVVVKAVEYAGMIPIYADISDNDLNFNISEIERLYTSDVKAIIVQNSLGFLPDIRPIEEFCKKNNIILIEDLAHSVGGRYIDGREAGTVSDYSILSFSQDKLLDSISGGALIFRDVTKMPIAVKWKHLSVYEKFRDRCYPLSMWKVRHMYNIGIGKLLHNILKRTNFISKPVESLDRQDFKTISGWYATLALGRFNSLQYDLKRRRKICSIYLKSLGDMIHPIVTEESISRGTCLRVPILCENRDSLIEFLKNKSIYISDIWYDVPIAPKKYWGEFEKNFNLPNSTAISKKMLNLPTHATMTERDAKRIVENIKLWQALQLKK